MGSRRARRRRAAKVRRVRGARWKSTCSKFQSAARSPRSIAGRRLSRSPAGKVPKESSDPEKIGAVPHPGAKPDEAMALRGVRSRFQHGVVGSGSRRRGDRFETAPAATPCSKRSEASTTTKRRSCSALIDGPPLSLRAFPPRGSERLGIGPAALIAELAAMTRFTRARPFPVPDGSPLPVSLIFPPPRNA